MLHDIHQQTVERESLICRCVLLGLNMFSRMVILRICLDSFSLFFFFFSFLASKHCLFILSTALHHSEGFGATSCRADETLLQQPSLSWNPGRGPSSFVLFTVSSSPSLFLPLFFLLPSISPFLWWQRSQHHD